MLLARFTLLLAEMSYDVQASWYLDTAINVSIEWG